MSELQGPRTASLGFPPSALPSSFCWQPFHCLLGARPSPLNPPSWGANPQFNKRTENTLLPWPVGEVQPSSAGHCPSLGSRRHPRSELEARRLCAQSCRGPRGEALRMKAPGVRRSEGETAPGSASSGLSGRWVTWSPFFLFWPFALGFLRRQRVLTLQTSETESPSPLPQTSIQRNWFVGFQEARVGDGDGGEKERL